ncbi:tRNA (adenosine(37)-N6)-threonylcarbamoyltransferase complex transferase subunit TsaD [Geoalkalibacter halelectricus]|uniref:tRNA N6-adenosine threonylcarbamoyltransferase n=1 Tax=Geoalkalibacter halelectricus TaxID=2847045 RepID=A0ABY5ZHF5_9BACT|nr:tRNA (adenosine(37)-N6)-threonylcarbamoyltransferase complex transferase subunit TsaD [Geoalkalibacter halelectricus]MDO3379643.1 tRNA (adenosine(37)-N6)-threonylcarbamoyltransferase complex transferase subunit TsaD [Geoalkalibacter halelectricus]UWZ78541.1 tRNA (adenosine(37)-N6)-threonylcarbamoyltransferase complex transferase subunit TsaD [Geoalkalibacter halelectricus]
MLLLCLESSCDETAAAVVRDGREVLSNVIASQVDVHARYGGVVPELASRKHLEAMPVVIEDALERAGLSIEAIEGVAVTRGPGLVGALLVALATGKAIAFARGIPWVGVHHIEGHALAIQLEQPVEYPFVSLIVSGGHTHLYLVEGVGRYRILGRTLDDASGEAYDKVAKLLGLGYPGGAIVDRLAAEGDPEAIVFPRPLLHQDNLDFSFSGIKTAVLNYVKRQEGEIGGQHLKDLAAGFQRAAVEVLTAKSLRALERTGLRRLVVAGGVACNRGLRQSLQKAAQAGGFEVYFPSPLLCTDNAAMLAVAADAYLERGGCSSLDLNALAGWPLDRAGDEFALCSP